MKNPGQNINLSIKIPAELAGKRLDQALAVLFSEFSRARLQQWIKDQQVQVDGRSKRPRDCVQAGATVTITAYLHEETAWDGQAIALDVVYEDNDIIVINKPIGLVVHPGAGNPSHTLANALLHSFPELNQLPRAGIIHRLDKDTSGLLVIARNLVAHADLVKQLQARSVVREYVALVQGVMVAGGTVNQPIGRAAHQRTLMAISASGKPAITHYRISERFSHHTLLYVKLETGRTHQIRVHMNYLNHPLVGDRAYSGRRQTPKQLPAPLWQALHDFTHQALHAQRLGLIHPHSREYCEWHAPIPTDFANLITLLQQYTALK